LTLVVLAPLSSIKTMKITSDTTITASEGELEVRMGKGMTSVYVKKQEKLVLYTNEVSTLIQLLQTANTNTPEANRDRALLLQELVATDPIISKFPTHHVVDAYQQMLRIAPELSSEKEITRAFLRQAGASQAISPFEAADLIKANTGLFKQHQLQRGLN